MVEVLLTGTLVLMVKEGLGLEASIEEKMMLSRRLIKVSEGLSDPDPY